MKFSDREEPTDFPSKIFLDNLRKNRQYTWCVLCLSFWWIKFWLFRRSVLVVQEKAKPSMNSIHLKGELFENYLFFKFSFPRFLIFHKFLIYLLFYFSEVVSYDEGADSTIKTSKKRKFDEENEEAEEKNQEEEQDTKPKKKKFKKEPKDETQNEIEQMEEEQQAAVNGDAG